MWPMWTCDSQTKQYCKLDGTSVPQWGGHSKQKHIPQRELECLLSEAAQHPAEHSTERR